MANSYPLDLVATPQVVPLSGAYAYCHNVTLAFDAQPSSGSVVIEYRDLGDPSWRPITNANGISIASGFFQVKLDSTVAALRVTFSGLVGGAGARIWDDVGCPSAIKRIETHEGVTDEHGYLSVIYEQPFLSTPSVFPEPSNDPYSRWSLMSSTPQGFTLFLSKISGGLVEPSAGIPARSVVIEK